MNLAELGFTKASIEPQSLDRGIAVPAWSSCDRMLLLQLSRSLSTAESGDASPALLGVDRASIEPQSLDRGIVPFLKTLVRWQARLQLSRSLSTAESCTP